MTPETRIVLSLEESLTAPNYVQQQQASKNPFYASSRKHIKRSVNSGIIRQWTHVRRPAHWPHVFCQTPTAMSKWSQERTYPTFAQSQLKCHTGKRQKSSYTPSPRIKSLIEEGESARAPPKRPKILESLANTPASKSQVGK